MSGVCAWFPMRHDEIVAWVEAHQDALPTNLAELARYPIPFRKVIVGFVSFDTRVALWREHLTSFLRDGSDLTAEQQASVADAARSLPTLIAAPTPNPVIVAWESHMAQLFTRPQAARIFGILGPPEPPDGLPLPLDAPPHGAA